MPSSRLPLPCIPVAPADPLLIPASMGGTASHPLASSFQAHCEQCALTARAIASQGWIRTNEVCANSCMSVIWPRRWAQQAEDSDVTYLPIRSVRVRQTHAWAGRGCRSFRCCCADLVAAAAVRVTRAVRSSHFEFGHCLTHALRLFQCACLLFLFAAFPFSRALKSTCTRPTAVA